MAADNAYSFALRLSPGQVIAYDGTYLLQVPSSNNGKDLTLASVKFGLVFRVEAVDGGGATLSAEYDRFETVLRNQPGNGAGVFSLGQRLFRFRVAANGRIQDHADGGWPADWSGLLAIWPGWPATPLRIGESWRTEGKTNLGGGQIAVSRTYRLCEVAAQQQNLALMSYTETGMVTGAVVALSDGQALLDGKILGVGEARFDLSRGLLAGAASVSTLNGTIHGNGNAAATLGTVRLVAETSVNLRT